jgi:hypothetical protein
MEGNIKAYLKMFNLFSLTRLMINKWILGGDESIIRLDKKGSNIIFYIKITTLAGVIYCLYMKQKIKLTNVITDGKRKYPKYSVLEARDLLGNSNEDATRATVKSIGM